MKLILKTSNYSFGIAYASLSVGIATGLQAERPGL
jgi:hypothetical protein